ncbi:DNA polymerase III subunit epsilon [Minwuia sp.]|uniref:DNA polymerase III subunit epsilon n=1 Tax=Minwuia sp. TaxID=2493630 RepID=UPI003A924ADF
MLDTETTGLDPREGDRIVEVACLELVDRVWTGRSYQEYVNPERAMPDEAFRIHGISDEMLADKPRFHEIADSFLAFVDGAPVVAHNAAFDMKFLNFELERCDRPTLPMDQVVDTLAIARKRFPGAGNSLDALCRRFEVDNTDRTLHGALIDSKLLADVYYHLVGVRQAGLELASGGSDEKRGRERPFREPRTFAVPEDERQAHLAFLEAEVTEPIWLKP